MSRTLDALALEFREGPQSSLGAAMFGADDEPAANPRASETLTALQHAGIATPARPKYLRKPQAAPVEPVATRPAATPWTPAMGIAPAVPEMPLTDARPPVQAGEVAPPPDLAAAQQLYERSKRVRDIVTSEPNELLLGELSRRQDAVIKVRDEAAARPEASGWRYLWAGLKNSISGPKRGALDLAQRIRDADLSSRTVEAEAEFRIATRAFRPGQVQARASRGLGPTELDTTELKKAIAGELDAGIPLLSDEAWQLQQQLYANLERVAPEDLPPARSWIGKTTQFAGGLPGFIASLAILRRPVGRVLGVGGAPSLMQQAAVEGVTAAAAQGLADPQNATPEALMQTGGFMAGIPIARGLAGAVGKGVVPASAARAGQAVGGLAGEAAYFGGHAAARPGAELEDVVIEGLVGPILFNVGRIPEFVKAFKAQPAAAGRPGAGPKSGFSFDDQGRVFYGAAEMQGPVAREMRRYWQVSKGVESVHPSARGKWAAKAEEVLTRLDEMRQDAAAGKMSKADRDLLDAFWREHEGFFNPKAGAPPAAGPRGLLPNNDQPGAANGTAGAPPRPGTQPPGDGGQLQQPAAGGMAEGGRLAPGVRNRPAGSAAAGEPPAAPAAGVSGELAPGAGQVAGSGRPPLESWQNAPPEARELLRENAPHWVNGPDGEAWLAGEISDRELIRRRLGVAGESLGKKFEVEEYGGGRRMVTLTDPESGFSGSADASERSHKDAVDEIVEAAYMDLEGAYRDAADAYEGLRSGSPQPTTPQVPTTPEVAQPDRPASAKAAPIIPIPIPPAEAPRAETIPATPETDPAIPETESPSSRALPGTLAEAEQLLRDYRRGKGYDRPAGTKKEQRARDAVQASDVELQRLTQHVEGLRRAERARQSTELAAGSRDKGIADVAAGTFTRDSAPYAPIHLLPRDVRDRVVERAELLLARVPNPDSATAQALRSIIAQDGSDVGAAAEGQRRRILEQLIGDRDVRTLEERTYGIPGPEPDPVVTLFLDPDRASKAKAALDVLRGEPSLYRDDDAQFLLEQLAPALQDRYATEDFLEQMASGTWGEDRKPPSEPSAPSAAPAPAEQAPARPTNEAGYWTLQPGDQVFKPVAGGELRGAMNLERATNRYRVRVTGSKGAVGAVEVGAWSDPDGWFSVEDPKAATDRRERIKASQPAPLFTPEPAPEPVGEAEGPQDAAAALLAQTRIQAVTNGRILVRFTARPVEAVREALTAAGFTWFDKSGGYWLSPSAMEVSAVERLLTDAITQTGESDAVDELRQGEAGQGVPEAEVQGELGHGPDSVPAQAEVRDPGDEAAGELVGGRSEGAGLAEPAAVDTPAPPPAGVSAEPPAAPAGPTQALVDELLARIQTGRTLPWQELFEIAGRHLGGTMAAGTFEAKDAYDALELALAKLIATDPAYLPTGNAASTSKAIDRLRDLVRLLPTQTRRSAEMEAFQQFSTPPAYALVANWAANLRAGDVVLEPSAGTGILASFALGAKRAGVVSTVYGNELSTRRAGLLKLLGLDAVFTENAEQLNRILPADVVPTVVVMNPPFSQTAGRMKDKKDLMAGARHVEQALERLADGGRLVAIVGRGMTMDAPTYRDWWRGISRKYHVRANVGVEGSVYSKMGTSFDTRLLVIDKVAPDRGRPTLVLDNAPTSDLLGALETLRHDRPPLLKPAVRPAADADLQGQASPRQGGQPTSTSGAGAGEGVLGERPGADAGGARPGGVPGPARSPEQATIEFGEPDAAVQPEQPGGGTARSGPAGGAEPTRRGDSAGRPPRPGVAGADVVQQGEAVPAGPAGGAAAVEPAPSAPAGYEAGIVETTDEAGVFERYRPGVTFAGAKPHLTDLVESSAMASVRVPRTTYVPNLPPEIITNGELTDVQLEALALAGAAHEVVSPDGRRRGFLVGHGTGVGKGRISAGVILDNWRRGRQKAVWVSENWRLGMDAKRDWSGLGQDPALVFLANKFTSAKPLDKLQKGVVFTTYSTLRGKATSKRKESRVDQLVNWLGEGFDGVIVFDEAHNMGNAIDTGSGRGKKKASAQALSGLELQRRLPNARIVYLSATAATTPANLAFGDRLGLWGEGTAFPDVANFISQISVGGIAAMEMVARDMKSLGLYVAATLDFKGTEQATVIHDLTPQQVETYNAMADMWQGVLGQMDAALESLGAVGQSGKVDAKTRSLYVAQFWSAHQRFFNSITTGMAMPSVIKSMREKLAEGYAITANFVETGEAATDAALADASADDDLEGLDVTPRAQLGNFLNHTFPTQAMETYLDENDNERMRPVVDSKGNPVMDPGAVAIRDALLDKLGSLNVPEAALDQLIEAFGVENVAEVTGRESRLVRTADGRVNLKRKPDHDNPAEVAAFLDGRKQILAFSKAGATGASYHANPKFKNQKRRAHYTLQAGFEASRFSQSIGRVHRAGQVSAPLYLLTSVSLPGAKRFLSTIARKLDTMGAMSKGAKKAAGQVMISERDNLENRHAQDALNRLMAEFRTNRGPIGSGEFEQQTGLDLSKDGPVKITQFLNRLLSMRVDAQEVVFNAFSHLLDLELRAAAENGTLDVGMEDVRADRITVRNERDVYTHPTTGAKTKYVEISLGRRPKKPPLAVVRKGLDDFVGYFRHLRSGTIYAVGKSRTRTDETGGVSQSYKLVAPDGVPSYLTEDQLRVRAVERLPALYEIIPMEDEAERLWREQQDNLPEFVERPLHLMTGALLPVWDRMSGGRVVVNRVVTDDGRRYLGRAIDELSIDQVLENLGADSRPGAGLMPTTAAEVMTAVMTDGSTLRLANDWTLKRSVVAGEDRFEIEGWTPADRSVLLSQGAFSERHQFKVRVFVPVGAEDVLARILLNRPVVRVTRRPGGGGSGLRGGKSPRGGAGEQLFSEPLTGPQYEALKRMRDQGLPGFGMGAMGAGPEERAGLRRLTGWATDAVVEYFRNAAGGLGGRAARAIGNAVWGAAFRADAYYDRFQEYKGTLDLQRDQFEAIDRGIQDLRRRLEGLEASDPEIRKLFEERDAEKARQRVLQSMGEKIADPKAILDYAEWSTMPRAMRDQELYALLSERIESALDKGDWSRLTDEERAIAAAYRDLRRPLVEAFWDMPEEWRKVAVRGGIRNIEDVMRHLQENPERVYLRRYYLVDRRARTGPYRRPQLVGAKQVSVGPRVGIEAFKYRKADYGLFTLHHANGEVTQFWDESEAHMALQAELEAAAEYYGPLLLEKKVFLEQPFDDDVVRKLKPIRDVRERMMRSLMRETASIESMKLFGYLNDTVARRDVDFEDEIEADPEGGKRGELVVGGDVWRRLPADPVFGALAGAWVPEPVHSNVTEQTWVTNGIVSAVHNIWLYAWKRTNTIWNLPTHVGNWVGQTYFWALDGFEPFRSPAIAIQAIRELRTRGPAWKELRAANEISSVVLDEDMLAQTLKWVEVDGLPAIDALAKLGDWLKARTPRGAFNAAAATWRGIDAADAWLTRFYDFVDSWSKVASYMYKRDVLGMPPEVARSGLWMYPNYERAGSVTKWMRRTALGSLVGGPFVSFFEHAARATTWGVHVRPGRVAALWLLPFLATMAGLAVIGSRRSERELVKAGRRSPFVIVLPWRDGRGKPMTIDLTYVLPLASEMDMGNGAGGLSLPVVFSHPFTSAVIDVIAGRKAYSGELLSSRNAGLGERVAKSAAHVIRNVAPAPRVLVRGIPRVLEATFGETTPDSPEYWSLALKELFGIRVAGARVTRDAALRLIRQKLGEDEVKAAVEVAKLYNESYRRRKDAPMTSDTFKRVEQTRQLKARQ